MFSKWTLFSAPSWKTNEHGILTAYFISSVPISKPPSVLLCNKLCVFFCQFCLIDFSKYPWEEKSVALTAGIWWKKEERNPATREKKQGLVVFTGTKPACCCYIICVTGLCPQCRPLGWSRLEAVRQLRRMGPDSQHRNNRQINRALGDTASDSCKNRIQDKRNSVCRTAGSL